MVGDIIDHRDDFTYVVRAVAKHINGFRGGKDRRVDAVQLQLFEQSVHF